MDDNRSDREGRLEEPRGEGSSMGDDAGAARSSAWGPGEAEASAMEGAQGYRDSDAVEMHGEYRVATDPSPVEEELYEQPAPYQPVQQVNVAARKGGSSMPVALGALVLLVAVAGLVAWLALNRAGETRSGASVVERALPANTLGYFSIDPSPDENQKRAFDKMLDAFESQPGFREAMAQMVQQVEGLGTMIGMQPDQSGNAGTLTSLAGYLGGGLTVAVLAPSDADLQLLKASSSSGNPMGLIDSAGRNIVGLADLDFNPSSGRGPITDLRALKESLDKAKVVETYNGVDVREYVSGSLRLYFAFLPDTTTAAVAINIAPIKVVIDEFKANKGLKDNTGFKYLSGKVPPERVAALYLNLGEINKGLEALRSGDPFYTEYEKLSGAMLATLSGQEDGLQVDIATEGGGLTGSAGGVFGLGFFDVQVNPNARPDASTLNDIPSDSFAFLAGSDFKSIALAAIEKAEKSSSEYARQGVADMQKNFKDSTGLDLKNDVLALMGGDFVVSVPKFTTGEPMFFIPPFLIQMKLSEADRAQAADALKRGLEKAFGGRSMSFELAGGTFYTMDSEDGIVGVAKDRALMTFTALGLEAAKARAEGAASNLGKGLGTTAKWKDAVRHLPKDSNLIGYFDTTAFLGIQEEGMSPEEKAEYEKNSSPFVRPLRYVLIGSATDPAKEGGMSRNLTRIFLGISK
jgi:hypothetical protein